MHPGPPAFSKAIQGLRMRAGSGEALIPRRSVLFVGYSSGCRIQNQPPGVIVTISVEVEHVVERAGNRIVRAVSDSSEIPVVFNEAEDGRLIRDSAIDVVLLCPGRNHQQRQPRTKAAAAILGSPADVIRFWRAAIAWSQQLVVGHIRLGDNGPHLVV